MRKSGITLQYHKKVAIGYFLHNSREKPTANSIFKDQKNIVNVGGKKAMINFFNELKKREAKYIERTGKNLQKNAIKHISAIVNLDHFHTEEDLKKLIEWLEKELGTKVIQYAIHLDEGHIDENGNKKINYHAHLEMLALDENGYSIRRKISPSFLRKLQTKTAEILNMPRGESVKKTKRKRLDTYQYKEAMRLADKQKLELKNEIKKLNEEKEKLANEINELKKEKEQLEKENLDLKNEIKERRNKLKMIREILININKQIKLFNKQDYKKMQEIRTQLKQLKKEANSKIINEIDNNINHLIDEYINMTGIAIEQNKEIKILAEQLQQLKSTKNTRKTRLGL